MKKREFNIAVIGDVMVDEYIQCTYKSASVEADVGVYNYKSRELRAGGAANVALNLKSLGCHVQLFGVIGDDAYGSALSDICTYKGVNTQFLIDSSRHTTLKTRLVQEEFLQILRLDREAAHDIKEIQSSKLLEKLDKIHEHESLDAIVIQDYNKGVINRFLLDALFEFAERHQIPTLADPKVNLFHELSKATVFKPNIRELSLAAGYAISPDQAELDKAIRRLGIPANDNYVFITLASKGIYFAHGNASGIIDGHVVATPDVSGAGDTVIAALTISLLNQLPVIDMAAMANKAGAAACNLKGVQSIGIEALIK